MPFPTTPLDVRVELNIGGVWTDITSDVYLRNPISITTGRADEASEVDSSKCALTLNNRGGKYSPRNPRSPYFGSLGRNTPVRVTVPGPRYLLADPSAGAPGAVATITGGTSPDLDVRFDAALTNWTTSGSTQLAGRGDYYTGSEDWLLLARDGRLHFEWSPTGTGTIQADSVLPLPVPASGRLAVRATLDADNGAGGWTVAFYTAQSMDGPWTPLGDPVTGTGATSVHAGGAMRFGTGWPNLPFPSSDGRIYGFQVLDGIDGPPLSVIDMATITVDGGGALLLDPQGTYWTLNSGSSVDDRYRRFTGEVSYWPQRWDVSGNDVYTPLTAAGILRRLGQGDKPLQSALRRRLTAVSPTPLAYWPFEGDGTDTDHAYSPLPDVPAMRARNLKWSDDNTLPSSSPLPTVDTNGSIHGRVPATSNQQGWHVEMVYRLEAMPASDHRMLRVDLAGTRAAFVEVRFGHDYVLVQTTDSDGNTIDFINGTDPAIAAAAASGTWQRMMLFSGVDTAGKTYIRWQTVSVETGAVLYAYLTVQDGSQAGRVDTVSANWGSAFTGMSLGHLAVFDVGGDTGRNPGVHAFDGAVQAFAGEGAHERIVRLAGEENIPLHLVGDTSGSEAVGPQRADTFLDLVQAAVDVDGGMLHEDLWAAGLVYRTRGTLYSQTLALSLDYEADGEVMPPLEPVDDDQSTRNDITISREGGSSARAVQATGPLSVQEPPVGVGLYDTSLTLDAYQDRQLLDLAAWQLHLGTWDEARYPTVHVALHAAPHLIPAVLDLRLLDRAQIAHPPAWLPPDPIDLLVEGYTETIGVYSWDLEFNCSPAGPWAIGSTAGAVPAPGDPVRADTDGSELDVAVLAGDTAIAVSVTAGPLWISDPAELPFDVRVGGEVMRVTAVTGAASPQTFTVQRGVNGIDLDHQAGTDVCLAHPAIVAL